MPGGFFGSSCGKLGKKKKIRSRPSFCSPKFRNNFAAESAFPLELLLGVTKPWRFQSFPWEIYGELLGNLDVEYVWESWDRGKSGYIIILSLILSIYNSNIMEYPELKDTRGSLIREPKIPPWERFPKVPGALGGLGMCPIPGELFQCLKPFGGGIFPDILKGINSSGWTVTNWSWFCSSLIHISLPCISMIWSDFQQLSIPSFTKK